MRRSPAMVLFPVVVLAILLASSQVMAWTVNARVNRDSLTTGDSLVLTVAVKGGEGRVDVAPLEENFQVVSQGRASSTRIVNGRREDLTEYHFQLRPRAHGVLAIPPLDVEVEGRTHRTNLIRLRVTEQARDETTDSDVKVLADVSADEVWLGQPLLYRFRLLHRTQLGGAELDKPSFEGFAARELKERKGTVTYEGREFAAIEIPYLLSPLRPGEVVIGPATLSCDVLRRRSMRFNDSVLDSLFSGSFFGSSMLGVRPEHRVLSTEPVTITVKPLPPYRGEGRFSGLVGSFDLRVDVDRTAMQTGESATLRVMVEGKGNLPDAAAPELDPPDGLKVYQDAAEEDVRPGPEGYSGRKVFRWALVPVQPGDYSLGPFSLTYFDPQSGEYVTRQAGTVDLTVEGSPLDSGTVPPPAPAPADESVQDQGEVADLGEDILPLMDPALAVRDQRPMSPALFLLLLAAVPMAWGAALVWIRIRERDPGPGKVLARQARKELARAARVLAAKDADGFPKALYRALVKSVRAAAQSPGATLTAAEMKSLLESASKAGLVDMGEALLADVEAARYSGAGLGAKERERLLSRTRKFVKEVLR